MTGEASSSLITQQHEQPALSSDSYTAQRLQHATAEHLYITTRRCFIGPIPEGWLKSHRREWYKRHLHIHYGSGVADFSAGSEVNHQRAVTGLDAPATARYERSFPRPEELYEEEDELAEDEDGEVEGEPEEEATLEAPPALPIPRSQPGGIDGGLKEDPVMKGNSQDGPSKAKDSAPQINLHKSLDGPRSPTLEPVTSRLTSRTKSRDERRPSKASFVTARESLDIGNDSELAGVGSSREGPHTQGGLSTPAQSLRPSRPSQASFAGTQAASYNPASSTTSLLQQHEPESQAVNTAQSKNITSKSTVKDAPNSAQAALTLIENALELGSDTEETTNGTVRFDLPTDVQKERHIKQRLAQMPHRRTFRKLRRGTIQSGEIIKMEKMLVRVEKTTHEVVPDFDEGESGKIETTTFEKWREYMVVCRESAGEDTDFTLQLYKTRAIPAIEQTGVKNKVAHAIPLNRTSTKVNLYSSLDKTMVIWVPYERGTLIYIMQPRSNANSMEWYTFIRNVLGIQRSSTLQINVPDLSARLQLEDPFDRMNAGDLSEAASGDDDAIKRTISDEHAAVNNIILRCQDMLEQSPEYSSVVKEWAKEGQLGLAWKRYDRLEWVNGQNEKKMYGTIGMMKSHELELRPKQHYPTTVVDKKERHVTEPPPVEGFLIRLTSQRGIDQKLGRLFFKRLYFSTHSQLLVFNRPARADPPPPPRMPMQKDHEVPTAHQIAEKIPLIYSVNPFPIEDGEIEWLRSGHFTTEESEMHDRDAYDESERKLNLLLKCDGSIDLTNVVKVRNVVRGATAADENIDSGSEVNFDESVADTQQDDGTTHEFDDNRTFELVLINGLVVRLQAFNSQTKNEWKHRLRALVKYWKLRTAADIALHKSVRQQNFTNLNLDEELEARVGQFAQKWEVTHSFASPELYHMCGVCACRSVSMSGTLYRKPHMHASFNRMLVVLCAGTLIVFRDALRSATGAVLRYIHNERVDALDLRDCYVYSGRQTDHDMVYSPRNFDNSNPGRHGLPKIYAKDGWTSTDEDSATCFVVWHSRRKGWFRSEEEHLKDHHGRKMGGLRRVTVLGAEGRSVVFKARSRAERDHWVMSIATEIERLGQGVDSRVVGGNKDGGIGAGKGRDKGKARA